MKLCSVRRLSFAQRSLLESPPQTRGLYVIVEVSNPCQPLLRGSTLSLRGALRVCGIYQQSIVFTWFSLKRGLGAGLQGPQFLKPHLGRGALAFKLDAQGRGGKESRALLLSKATASHVVSVEEGGLVRQLPEGLQAAEVMAVALGKDAPNRGGGT